MTLQALTPHQLFDRQIANRVIMHIARIYIDGFKRLADFDLKFNDKVTVIVGDNEAGKTSVMEAIHLVLTRQYEGRVIDHALDPYLFNNKTVAMFFQAIRDGANAPPPRILIEAYLSESNENSALASLKGRNNSKNEDCPGVKLCIELDPEFGDLLKEYAKDPTNPGVLPVEFYRCHWRSFADNGIASRTLAFKVKTIDTSLPRILRGPNRYVSQLVDDVLTDNQRRDLSLAYKKLQHGFSQEGGVKAINDHLMHQGKSTTNKKLTVQVDMSSRSTWDTAIAAHLDDLPFDCAGKGEQCRIQMRLAVADAKHSRTLLIEEPENHLSHSNLNMLMNDIRRDCEDRQVVLTTHSAFVLNKLGLHCLRLISRDGKTTTLSRLIPDTQDYFMKLPGYDTLRMILSKRCILVEGPSDELIVQRAYKDLHEKLPLEDGIDVISVGALAFKRFLEIAALLGLRVSVITDNDGDVAALKTKYSEYLDGKCPAIEISYDDNETCKTLEPQLLKTNSLDLLNKILNTKHKTDEKLLAYMNRNKTDCALKFFETDMTWSVPEYIANVIR